MLRKRILALLVCWSASPLVLALGLGPVTTSSALNEPFEGRIEILKATAEDFDNLTIGLAGADHFARAGVALNPVLFQLKFELGQRGAAVDHITISSKDPIREPFLNFLLELNWSNGRLLREYTVLLDPPLYDPSRRMAPAALGDEPAPPPPDDEETIVPTPAPTRVVAPAGYAPGKKIGQAVATDTLWSLASAYRPSEDISVQQMMLAFLRANPEAFSSDNVNMLRYGAALRLPDEAEITSLSISEALAEAKRQHQLWEEYRQQVAQTPSSQPLGADRGAPTYAEDGDAADARLELVAPGAGEGGSTPGEAAGSAGTDLLREQLEGQSQQNVELQGKLSEAEEIIDLLQRQVNIKDEELAALQARLAELEAVEDEPVIEDEPLEVEPVEVDELLAAAPPAARGFPGNLIPEHIAAMVPGGALTILGVVAIVILALFVMVVQFLMRAIGARTAAPADEPGVAVATEVDDDTEDPTLTAPTATPEKKDRQAAAMDAAVAEGPEETIPPDAQTIEAEAASLSGQTQEQEALVAPAAEEDPLEEVNVYLAYERFDQAEELVKRVLAEFPDRHEYKLRLLEVYYSSNNKAAYEDAARSLQDAVGEDDALWESAIAMWSEMSPERALFEAGAEPEAAADEGADLDFDIGGLALEDSQSEPAPRDAAAAPDPDEIPTVNLDSAMAEMAEAAAEPDIDSLEFDITVEDGDGIDKPSSGEELDVSDDLDLDITVDEDKPAAGELDPADLSLQGAELDELALDAGGGGESKDFDFSLEGTSEMDSIMADDTIDMVSVSGDEATRDMGDDASLDDLALELDESLTDTSDLGRNGLEGLALDDGDGDHLETLETDSDGLPREDLGAEKTVVMPLSDDIERRRNADETDSKLDLAKAYIELGDSDGARAILDEVARDGNDAQKAEAQSLFGQLS